MLGLLHVCEPLVVARARRASFTEASKFLCLQTSPSETPRLIVPVCTRMWPSSCSLRIPSTPTDMEKVSMVIEVNKKKFEDLMTDGVVRLCRWEVSHRFTWSRKDTTNFEFETTLHNFVRDLSACRGEAVGQQLVELPLAQLVVHPYLDQIHEDRVLVWMEGRAGWTTCIQLEVSFVPIDGEF
ncbi:hypothetical protein SUGI_1062590 [Cryptomeria japonica]|nr:hypothetical protein SUGI_1062590 [Cryptomeria japonica]